MRGRNHTKNPAREMLLFKKIQALSDLTLQVTANFPGQYAHIFRDRIIGLIIDVVALSTEANTMRVTDATTYQYCVRCQNKFLSNLRTVETLLQQAVRLKVTSAKRVAAWAEILVEVKRLHYGWMKVYPKRLGG
jgi:hypothetical protein